MFNYVTLGTNDFAAALHFYDAVMHELGHQRCHVDFEAGWAGWGIYQQDGTEELVLWLCRPFNGATATTGNGTMVALTAARRAQVDAFHATGLRHGGSCEGPPGIREHYGPNFYAAYLRDPDGNKLAAVCRGKG